MLSNSIAAGLLADAYVLVLFLQLNPALSSDARGLTTLATTIGVFYLVHLTAACYILLVAGQLLSRELFSPAWLSVSVLSWLGAAASAAAAVLMWANVRTFGIVLEQTTIDRMSTSIVVLAAASALFTIVALARARAVPMSLRECTVGRTDHV